ncbi:GNAT family N-acetyltransferase [Indiicoccus explosivorum]|uniref:GNAT family N-acetyltransferase n=1 Tax=Indiicoccus explosivorum TaxID=1917864 RepID=UPI000B4381BC|nr:GNAT family N-acetyltransferase [Indiicoccus explosivorum]
MTVTIRKAEQEDIPGIQRTAKISWQNTYRALIPSHVQEQFIENAYSDEMMQKRLERSILIVAEEDGEIIGFANGFTNSEKAELAAIYLLPEVQGRGIGTRLLEAVVLNLDGYQELFVEVEKGNDRGEQFYEAKGFRFVREYEDELFGHKLRTKQLVLPIN